MANHCSGHVQFEASEDRLKRLFKFINKSIEKMVPGEGFRFILLPPNYFFQKVLGGIDADDDYSLRFETNWAPDPVQIIQMCKPFGVSFVYSYEEGSMYGEFLYDVNLDILQDRQLSDEQYNSCQKCGHHSDSDGKDICPTNCNGNDECDSQETNYEQMDNTLSHCEWESKTYIIETCEYG
jgi:hypothetical protein